jgi:hypothetical protein
MFRLEQVAKDQLRMLAAASGCSDPIAMLSKRSGIFDGDADFQGAFSRGNSAEMSNAAERIAGGASSELMLDVSFYDRQQLPVDSVVNVDGISFMLTQPLLQFLEDLTLSYHGRFLLKDLEGREIDLPIGPVGRS